MQSRQAIENLLRHYREGHCSGPPEECAREITTLEWVLGDAPHQAQYAAAIAMLRNVAEDEGAGVAPLRVALRTALSRL